MAHDELNTRRGLLRWGARLAVAAPAMLAGLQVAGATAHADGDDGHGHGHGNGHDHDHDEDDNNNAANVNNARGNTTFSADLVPTNMISGDFSGVGDTGTGTLSVTSNGTANTANIGVVLRGATANTTYNVIFETIGGGRSGVLGSFTTNASGAANAFFSGVLSESGSATSSGLGTRVGVFVLNKAAGDAFVTAA